MQLKDVPKTVIATIRAITQAIDGVQEQLREHNVSMEIPIDSPWTMLQEHMKSIEGKLESLTNIIELQDRTIKAIQTHQKDRSMHPAMTHSTQTTPLDQMNYAKATQKGLPHSHASVISQAEIKTQ